MMMKVGVMGVGGYSGEELVRLLLKHPQVEMCCLQARVEKPTPLSKVLPSLGENNDFVCENYSPEAMAEGCDLVFLALPHTVSMEAASTVLKAGKKVIDLSADFRLKTAPLYEKAYKTKHLHPELLQEAVYGLPEFFREKIKKTRLVANPGCYPTAVLLGSLPLFREKKSREAFFIADAKSGFTGAGRKQVSEMRLSESGENFKAYRVAEHQHVPEMESILKEVLDLDVKLMFTPHLLPISRGILSTHYFCIPEKTSEEELRNTFQSFYQEEPFVRVLGAGELPEIKNVLHTNFCEIAVRVDPERKTAIVIVVIDNLMKGASGQAVQNFNLLFGFQETEGLLS